MLRTLRNSYSSSLHDFVASPSTFRLLRSLPESADIRAQPVKTLYVLDASFNPPTRAHSRMALSALKEDTGESPKSLLLLLATQNADKSNKPASLEHRLVMMTLLAQELHEELSKQGDGLVLHVGMAKAPYFHDKAKSIEEDEAFSTAQQVHLMGFDTLIRLFDPKYYPPNEELRVLSPFLSRHRVRVTCRPDSEWGSRDDQQRYVRAISNGERAQDGADAEWGSRINLVDGKKDDEEVVSSTMARAAAKAHPKDLDRYVMPSIRDWILSEELYVEG